MIEAPPVKPIGTAEVAAFLRDYLPECHGWTDEKLHPWVQWYQRHDRALVITDEADQIVGVALGRFIHDATNAAHDGLFDEAGAPILWVDAIVARRREVIGHMLTILSHKWGTPTTVAGLCFSRARELRMFPIKQLTRFFGTS